jgi:hypothetical protein
VTTQNFNHAVDVVVGNVEGGGLHVHLPPHPQRQLPPPDPEVAILCEQCRWRTWRYSQFCMHCKVDLFAWRIRAHRAKVRARATRLAIGTGSFAATAVCATYVLPSPFSGYAALGAFGSAFMTVKFLEISEANR